MLNGSLPKKSTYDRENKESNNNKIKDFLLTKNIHEKMYIKFSNLETSLKAIDMKDFLKHVQRRIKCHYCIINVRNIKKSSKYDRNLYGTCFTVLNADIVKKQLHALLNDKQIREKNEIIKTLFKEIDDISQIIKGNDAEKQLLEDTTSNFEKIIDENDQTTNDDEFISWTCHDDERDPFFDDEECY